MAIATQAKIVCATDFSPNAAGALRWALTVAAAPGDSIDLVTVLAPPTIGLPESATDAVVRDVPSANTAQIQLREVAEATKRDFGLAVTPYVLAGEAHRAIAAHAESVGARLTVLGAYGGSMVERWILGSVAERTVRIASRPVAVVTSREDEHEEPTPGGPARQGIRVLVGLEGGPADDRALDLVRDLRRTRSCDVTLLHLYWPIVEYRRLGLQGSRDFFVADPDVVRSLEPALRDRVGTLSGQGTVTLSIRPAWGDPAANLLAAADEGDYQIVIVGAERRHGVARLWHGSTAQRVVRRAGSAVVICVPPPAVPEPPPPAAGPPRLSTVLAPTDLSAVGNAAIPYAYALVAAAGGVVELCHVHQRSLPNPPFSYDEPRNQLSPEAVADLERQLRAIVPPFAERAGVRTHVSVIEGGPPAEAIVQAAERLGVDAISLGSHGHGSLAGVLLGSVAQKVVQASHKPVLIVPSPRLALPP